MFSPEVRLKLLLNTTFNNNNHHVLRKNQATQKHPGLLLSFTSHFGHPRWTLSIGTTDTMYDVQVSHSYLRVLLDLQPRFQQIPFIFLPLQPPLLLQGIQRAELHHLQPRQPRPLPQGTLTTILLLLLLGVSMALPSASIGNQGGRGGSAPRLRGGRARFAAGQASAVVVRQDIVDLPLAVPEVQATRGGLVPQRSLRPFHVVVDNLEEKDRSRTEKKGKKPKLVGGSISTQAHEATKIPGMTYKY